MFVDQIYMSAKCLLAKCLCEGKLTYLVSATFLCRRELERSGINVLFD
jgi:hypothetical protein